MKMTRYVRDADLVALYNLVEIFALPSLYDGFGLPTTVVLDRDHKMRFRHNNIVDKATLDAEVSTLLNQ